LATIDERSGAPAAAEVPLIDGYAETDLQQGVRAIQSITLPPRVLDSYAGCYSTSGSGRIILQREGDHLVMTAGREPTPTELFAVDEQELSDADGGARVSVLVDPSGRASAVVVHHGFQETLAHRSEPR
jgi:hypothetical protein